jgi:hypothetical protein
LCGVTFVCFGEFVKGGTAIIAGKDKTQAQQKRYRYTGKERDDSSGLCYYGARYLGVLSLLFSLRTWVPMCRVLLCCFVWLVEMSSAGPAKTLPLHG